MRAKLIAATVVGATVMAMVTVMPPISTAGADSDPVNASPYTCTTSPDFGNQAASWTSTVSDDHDPAAVGDAMTYDSLFRSRRTRRPLRRTTAGER